MRPQDISECGLWAFDDFDRITIPVKSASLKCTLNNLCVNIVSTFTYENPSEKCLEATYVFPLDESSAVYHFEAQIEDRTIIASCRPKPEARETYDEAVAAGHTAVYTAEDDHAGDVFQLKIGNIPSKGTVTIVMKYVSLIETDTVYWKDNSKQKSRLILTLPTVLNPRYSPDATRQNDYSDRSMDKPLLNSLPYTIDFGAKLVMTCPIADVTSTRDTYEVKYDTDNKKEATITMKTPFKPDHDLQMVIDLDGHLTPLVAYEKGSREGTSFLSMDCLSLHFISGFDEVASQQELRNELVFLIDRSGSMDGENIEYAKQSLLLLLKSLPASCRLQIIGFGSDCSALFDGPVDYTEETLNRALQYQSELAADMGGTEIYAALKSAYSAPLSGQGWYRQIILLTDGDVWNTDQVLGLVRSNVNKARVFAIGLGEGASTALVSGLARTGRGTASFVRESSQLVGAVMKILNAALQPRANDVKLEWMLKATDETGKTNPIEVVTIPSHAAPILPGCLFTSYGLFVKSSQCRVSGSVRLQFELLNKTQVYTAEVDTLFDQTSVESDLPLHRLAAKCEIAELTDRYNELESAENATSEEGGSDKSNKPGNNEKMELAKEVERLSIHTNVVSPFTAFVGVDPKKLDCEIQAKQPVSSGGCFAYQKCSVSMPRCMPMATCEMLADPVPVAVGCTFNYCADQAASDECEVDSANNAVGLQAENFDDTPYQPPPPPPLRPLVKLAGLQQFAGNWKLDECTAELFQNGLDKLKAQVPNDWAGKSGQTVSDDMWATALALAYLEVELKSEQDDWSLLAMKAQNWLKSQLKSCPGNSVDQLCGQLIDLAKTALQSGKKNAS